MWLCTITNVSTTKSLTAAKIDRKMGYGAECTAQDAAYRHV